MLLNLLAAGASVVAAVSVTAAMLWALSMILMRLEGWLCRPPFGFKTVFSLAGVSAWLLMTMGLAILPWSLMFVWTGLLPDFETAAYFTSVTYTTLGYGDVVLPSGSRILSGLCAANGLLMFGLFTAYLVEFVRRLREAQNNVLAKSGAATAKRP